MENTYLLQTTSGDSCNLSVSGDNDDGGPREHAAGFGRAVRVRNAAHALLEPLRGPAAPAQ